MIIVPHNQIISAGFDLKKNIQVELRAVLTNNHTFLVNGGILLRNREECVEFRLEKPFAGGFHPTIIDCQLMLSDILFSIRGHGHTEETANQIINLAILKWLTLYFYMRPNHEIDHVVYFKDRQAKTRHGINLDGTTSYTDSKFLQSFFTPR